MKGAILENVSLEDVDFTRVEKLVFRITMLLHQVLFSIYG
jgi:hypothetical protein